ncbi:MAG: phosphoribosylanthranilate isomerase [Candidatus Omnitrophota bacterium]
MPKVKICGITNLGDAIVTEIAGVDIMGFVFAESARRIDVEAARAIIDKVSLSVKITALFVNEEKRIVDEIINKLGRVDLLQFHGDETPEYCEGFRGVKIIKAFRIKDESSLTAIKNFKNLDYILLDAHKDERYGGTGESFDWDIALKAKDYGIPIFLSGGLNPENVKEAILKVDPFAVDVSSGVEKEPGKKDQELVRRFISEVKSAK